MRPAKPKPRLAITLVIFFIALAVVIWKILIPMYFPGTIPNYAQEVAKPLEIALANTGAVKKYDNGDNGRDWGNSMPYYHVSFVVPKENDSAARQVSQIMQDNGFTLTKATPSNKGQLEFVVGDEHINSWYFDNTSKQSNFTDLVSGPIEVAVKIGDIERTDLPGETTVRIDLLLPHFKG